MDSSEFKNERTGKLQKLQNISGTVFHCFEPNKLPFDIEYSSELVELISEASMSLGNLSEAGIKLPNPHLLIMPYLNKEAVLSSKIEGTKATLSDVFIHDAKRKKTRDDDTQEVINYVRALQYGLSKVENEKVSCDMIKEMHRILLEGVRGEDRYPGNFKKDLNWIGTSYNILEANFVPCGPESVPRLMDNLMNYLNEYGGEIPLIKVGMSHYQFETIHPFRDGNGRIGRLLIILYLCQEGLISQPLFYISAFFEKHREDYVARLKKVSTDGDIDSWLKFFLTAVRDQAKDAVSRVEKMEELRERYRNKLLEMSQSTTVLQILDFLFENPFITMSKIKNRLDCGYSKVKYNVQILLKAGIIEERERHTRGRLFVSEEILQILE